MRHELIKVIAIVVAVISAWSQATNANAAINIADGAPVIGGSGAYPSEGYNDGAFPAFRVTDGAHANPDNNVGTITETFGNGYWIGPNDFATGYFVLDLGSAYNIGSFELFNTGNAGFQDRGTGNFTISGSNSVTNIGASGMDLVSPAQIVAGALTPQFSGPFLVPDVFTATNGGPYRYLRFDALSIGAIGSYGFNGVGLNEIRVFAAATPEPTAFIVMGAIGGVGFMLRRKLKVLMS